MLSKLLPSVNLYIKLFLAKTIVLLTSSNKQIAPETYLLESTKWLWINSLTQLSQLVQHGLQTEKPQ